MLPFNGPSRTKVSAVATMDSSFDRGGQPGMRLASSKQPDVTLSSHKFPVRVRHESQATIHGSRRGGHPSRLLCLPPRTERLRAVLYSRVRVLIRCGQVWSGQNRDYPSAIFVATNLQAAAKLVDSFPHSAEAHARALT